MSAPRCTACASVITDPAQALTQFCSDCSVERKTPGMEAVLEYVAGMAFGRSRREAGRNGTCVSCGVDVRVEAGEDGRGFRDEVSRKEYRISKLCQDCQDGVFSGRADRWVN